MSRRCPQTKTNSDSSSTTVTYRKIAMLTSTKSRTSGPPTMRSVWSLRPLSSATISSSLGGTISSNSVLVLEPGAGSWVSPTRTPSTMRPTRPTDSRQHEVTLSTRSPPGGAARAKAGNEAAKGPELEARTASVPSAAGADKRLLGTATGAANETPAWSNRCSLYNVRLDKSRMPTEATEAAADASNVTKRISCSGTAASRTNVCVMTRSEAVLDRSSPSTSSKRLGSMP
mmetsp:Transcript_92186/g.298183  ORF Transcript_92186/g.298183 Transcript_92186/m.298183 type:complete len:230 (+) Transcript_92186:288-977(+)